MKGIEIVKTIEIKGAVINLFKNLNNYRFKIIISVVLLSAIAFCVDFFKHIYKEDKSNTKENLTNKALAEIQKPKIEIKDTPKVDEKEELKSICNRTKCTPEDVVKITYEEYENMYIPSFVNSKVNLNHFSKMLPSGNVFFVFRKGVEAFAKAYALYGDKEHPLFDKDKKISDLIYIDFSIDSMPENLKSIGHNISKISSEAFIFDKQEFVNWIRETKEFINDNDSQIAIVNTSQFENLINNIDTAQFKFMSENIDNYADDAEFKCYKKIGTSGNNVFLSCKKGTLEKYNITGANYF